ncbi:FtsX-like permease family protein [Mucisphaera sp.]|uniref:ABC transporter permease n=1 Tax=Mucisphaera sp. TaxID=2913024 RepID=UPI003D15079E
MSDSDAVDDKADRGDGSSGLGGLVRALVTDVVVTVGKLMLLTVGVLILIGLIAGVFLLGAQQGAWLLWGGPVAALGLFLLLSLRGGVYQHVMVRRYLRRRLPPLFAALTVMLCTAMVIVVISVMGGFLDLLGESARRLTGDVVITNYGQNGFPHYDAMIERIEALPEVAAGAPMIEAYGLVRFRGQTLTVQVQGVDPERLDRVLGFRATLYWGTEDYLEAFDRYVESFGELSAEGRALVERQREDLEAFDVAGYGMAMDPPAAWQPEDGAELRGLVMGIEVNPFSQRDPEGAYVFEDRSLEREVTLTVVPITRSGALLDPAVRRMVVVNEFKSGLYDVDANRVYAPFELVQAMLRMDEAERVDPETGEPTGEVIASRASQVLIRSAEGYSPDETSEAVRAEVAAFQREMEMATPLYVMTWEQVHRRVLTAVQNEKGMVTFLFVIISIVAVVMVAVTFYMTVLSNIRDIGVIRAVGGSRAGILSIFLGYGLAIGAVGSLLGLALGGSTVIYLNELQDVIYRLSGWRMWDPQTYFFDRIPNQVNPMEALAIVLGAVLSSVIGAALPAIMAARLDPVEALRHE